LDYLVENLIYKDIHSPEKVLQK